MNWFQSCTYETLLACCMGICIGLSAIICSRAACRDAPSTADRPTGQKAQHSLSKHSLPQTRLSGKHGHFWAVYFLDLQIAQ